MAVTSPAKSQLETTPSVDAACSRSPFAVVSASATASSSQTQPRPDARGVA